MSVATTPIGITVVRVRGGASPVWAGDPTTSAVVDGLYGQATEAYGLVSTPQSPPPSMPLLAHQPDYPTFPYLASEIGENPARWLQYCDDDHDHRVQTLLESMHSLERARNWQYVADQLPVCKETRKHIAATVAALSTTDDAVDYRAQARAAGPRLRAVWYADTEAELLALRDQELANASRPAVIALVTQRLDDLGASDTPESDTEPAVGETSTDADSAVSASETEAVQPHDYEEAYDRAYALAADFGEREIRAHIEREQTRDDPRTGVIDALRERLAETTDADTASTTMTNAPPSTTVATDGGAQQ